MLMLRSLLTIIIVLLASHHLSAQPGDIPISPRDNGYRMVRGALVQDADSAEGNTMVVWGTTHIDGAVRIVIYAQLLHGTAPATPPMWVQSFDSSQLPRVRVVPLGPDFLIIASAYIRLFRTSTMTLGPAEYIEALAGITNGSAEVTVTGGPATGWRLYWRDNDNTLYTTLFDTAGRAVGSTVRLGHNPPQIRRYAEFPDLIFIAGSGNVFYVAHRNGVTIDSLPIPPLKGPWHLNPDTSLVVVGADSIYLYRSIFDTAVIARKFPLWSWYPMIARDDAGNIEVYVTETGDGIDAERPPWYMVQRVRFDTALNTTGIDTVLRDTLKVPRAAELNAYVGEYRTADCGDRTEVHIVYATPYDHALYDDRYLLLNGAGNLTVSNTPTDLSCGGSHLRPVPRRVPSDTASIVAVPVGDTVTLTTTIAFVGPGTHTRPGIAVLPTAVVCTWLDSSDNPGLRSAVWDVPTDVVGRTTLYTEPPIVEYGAPLFPYTVVSVTGKTESGIDSLLCLPGNVVVERDYSVHAYVKGAKGSNPTIPYAAWMATSRTAFARASPGGWSTFEMIRHDPDPHLPNFEENLANGSVLGSDPETGDIVALIKESDFGAVVTSELHVYRRSSAGPVMTAPATLTFGATAFPMGKARVLTVENDTATYIDSGRVRGSFAFPTAGHVEPRCFKLIGPYIARTSWRDTSGTSFTIETYDTAGRRLGAASIQRPERTNDYTLVASPADSLIAIVFASPRGVRATLLTRDLHVIAADTLLSRATTETARPAAGFYHDTLFVVWENRAASHSRIDGLHMMLRADPTLSVDRPEPSVAGTAADATAMLYPNPAAGSVTVRANLVDRGGITLELATTLGQIVLRRELFAGVTGVAEESVDIAALPPGVYLARMRTAGGTLTRCLVRK